MYAFGNRNDCVIVDEPFYAYYLSTHLQTVHPGRSEIIKSQSTNYKEVLLKVIFGAYDLPNVFFKNMAQHLHKADWTFLADMKNVLLIRDPKALIASFAQVIKYPSMLDIGLKLEFEIFQYLKQNGHNFLIVDSGNILKDPERMLTKLCEGLDITFDKKMLNWSAGPRRDDGVWAKYWYKNVHKSTGFTSKKISDNPFPKRLDSLLEEAEGYYKALYKESIKL